MSRIFLKAKTEPGELRLKLQGQSLARLLSINFRSRAFSALTGVTSAL
jgi:hypothetical protein